MKVCKIWDADYPWDVRAAKVCTSLTQAGIDVHLVANNRKGSPVVEKLPEATVHRLRPLPVGRKLSRASMFPAFFNPRWASLIRQTARTERADVILVRDLPLAPTAIRVGRQLGIPVVLDMAENYPAMMQSLYDNRVQRPWDVLVRNPAVVRAVERWVLRHIDAVLVVVEESRDRIVALGYPADRVTVVGNTPPLDRLAAPAHLHHDGVVHLNYLGILEAPRGLGVVIDAMARCVERRLPVRLSVIGSGREEAVFRAQAQALGLASPTLEFHGYLPNRDALRLVAESDVGLVPHQANESWNTTIPNKLFDYMAAGLAIISSEAIPAARIVRETGTGEVYAGLNPDSLADAIEALLDVDRRRECGEHGRKAVAGQYNWDADSTRLIDALHQAVARRR